MANELRVVGQISFSKGGATLNRNYNTSVTISGSASYSNVASVPTSDTSLDLGGISTVGYVMFNNLDATNYCDFGSDGTVYPIRVQPGTQVGPLSWNGAAIHAKAHTGATLIQYDIINT